MQPKVSLVALTAFYVVCALAVTGPGLSLVASHGETFAGVPMALAWNLGWVLASFVALGLYHRVTGGGENGASENRGSDRD